MVVCVPRGLAFPTRISLVNTHTYIPGSDLLQDSARLLESIKGSFSPFAVEGVVFFRPSYRRLSQTVPGLQLKLRERGLLRRVSRVELWS